MDNLKFDPSKHEKVVFPTEDLENLPIYDSYKVDLILAWKGFKPATEISVGDRNLGAENNEQACQAFETFCKKISLSQKRLSREEVHASHAHIDENVPAYAVGKKASDVDRLVALLNGENTHSEFGEIFGFPETAVEAFEAGGDNTFSIWDAKNVPPELIKEDYMAFGQLALSRKHWREEVEVVKRWAQAVRETDPNLYTRVVQNHHQTLDLYSKLHSGEISEEEFLKGMPNM